MSLPDFQERHQDYVIGPAWDSRLASVAAGAQVTGIEFQFDSDAPFLLRGRGYRVSYNNLDAKLQVGIENLGLKFTRGDSVTYTSEGYIPQNLVMPYGGQGGAWKSVYPQIFYAAGSVIRIDLINNGATALTNLTLFLRGVKLFPWGMNPSPTYPPKFRTIPFSYPIGTVTPQNTLGVIQNLLTADDRRNLVFQCGNDADFVFRYGQAGPSFAPFGLEVFVTLRDENQKAYSNAPVHVEMLFGPSIGNYTTGGTTIPAIGTGNSLPSVMYPEIYLQKNRLLYYDIQRKDSGYAGASTIPSYPITLIGQKVYAQ